MPVGPQQQLPSSTPGISLPPPLHPPVRVLAFATLFIQSAQRLGYPEGFAGYHSSPVCRPELGKGLGECTDSSKGLRRHHRSNYLMNTEIPRITTDLTWSEAAHDWIPIITLGTGRDAVKYYGIRCPPDYLLNGGEKKGGKRSRRGDRKAVSMKANWLMSSARAMTDNGYTITPYYDDVIGHNTCPRMQMDQARTVVEMVIDAPITEVRNDNKTGTEENKEGYSPESRQLWDVDMKKRVSVYDAANAALMEWKIAGPSSGGLLADIQDRAVRQTSEKGRLKYTTLSGKALSLTQAMRRVNTRAVEMQTRAQRYESEAALIAKDEEAAVREERRLRRRAKDGEREELAKRMRRIAARKRRLADSAEVIYMPDDSGAQERRERQAERAAKRQNRRYTPTRKEGRHEIVWYRPKNDETPDTTGSVGEAIKVYAYSGQAATPQNKARGRPTAQLVKRPDTTHNVVNTVTATPLRTDRESTAQGNARRGEIEKAFSAGGEKADGEEADSRNADEVLLRVDTDAGKVTRTYPNAFIGEPFVDQIVQANRKKGVKREMKRTASRTRARKDVPEMDDYFIAVSHEKQHISGTRWDMPTTVLESEEVSQFAAPAIQGSFMFPVIAYPKLEVGDAATSYEGQLQPTTQRSYVPHLCIGEIGGEVTGEEKDAEREDYDSTFGQYRVRLDRAKATVTKDTVQDAIEIVPGEEVVVEKAGPGMIAQFFVNGTDYRYAFDKRDANWCVSCPYAITEYANTPYQQTDHPVRCTVQSTPTVSTAKQAEPLCIAEYFSQFVNAQLATYQVGKEKKVWGAVGTINLNPSAVDYMDGVDTTSPDEEQGPRGWSNLSTLAAVDSSLRCSTQLSLKQYTPTASVVGELNAAKTRLGSRDYWNTTWSTSAGMKVRDYSPMALISDAGSFFGTWLATSNGVPDIGEESTSALFCSFNIRGGVMASTLVFVGNSFGERLGASFVEEEEEPEPSVPDMPDVPEVDDAVVFTQGNYEGLGKVVIYSVYRVSNTEWSVYCYCDADSTSITSEQFQAAVSAGMVKNIPEDCTVRKGPGASGTGFTIDIAFTGTSRDLKIVADEKVHFPVYDSTTGNTNVVEDYTIPISARIPATATGTASYLKCTVEITRESIPGYEEWLIYYPSIIRDVYASRQIGGDYIYGDINIDTLTAPDGAPLGLVSSLKFTVDLTKERGPSTFHETVAWNAFWPAEVKIVERVPRTGYAGEDIYIGMYKVKFLRAVGETVPNCVIESVFDPEIGDYIDIENTTDGAINYLKNKTKAAGIQCQVGEVKEVKDGDNNVIAHSVEIAFFAPYEGFTYGGTTNALKGVASFYIGQYKNHGGGNEFYVGYEELEDNAAYFTAETNEIFDAEGTVYAYSSASDSDLNLQYALGITFPETVWKDNTNSYGVFLSNLGRGITGGFVDFVMDFRLQKYTTDGGFLNSTPPEKSREKSKQRKRQSRRQISLKDACRNGRKDIRRDQPQRRSKIPAGPVLVEKSAPSRPESTKPAKKRCPEKKSREQLEKERRWKKVIITVGPFESSYRVAGCQPADADNLESFSEEFKAVDVNMEHDSGNTYKGTVADRKQYAEVEGLRAAINRANPELTGKYTIDTLASWDIMYSGESEVVEVAQDFIITVDGPAEVNNAFGAPTNTIGIPCRVKGTGDESTDTPGTPYALPLSSVVRPILSTSTTVLVKTVDTGLCYRVKKDNKWETVDTGSEIDLNPNTFSRLSSVRRPQYSQEMTGKWWSMGDIPLTLFDKETMDYRQIRGAVAGLFTGVIDFFDIEKQVMPASITTLEDVEKVNAFIDTSGGVAQIAAAEAEEISGIQDWADPSTNNVEHNGMGVFGRAQADPGQFPATPDLAVGREIARTLRQETTIASPGFKFTPRKAPLFFWHVSWGINYGAGPVSGKDKAPQLVTDRSAAAVGQDYYAKPLFAWTYGVSNKMTNIFEGAPYVTEEARKAEKRRNADGETEPEKVEKLDRESEAIKQARIPVILPAAALLNVGTEASVDVVEYTASE